MSLLITDEKVKKQVQFYINNNLSCNYTDFVFPISNVNFIKRDSIHKIKNEYNFLVNNFNSKRGIFILYKNENNENKQYILFKNGELIETNINCNESYYEDTILEVFYDNDNDNAKIKICDVFCCKGIKFNMYNFTTRYNKALEISKDCQDLDIIIRFYNQELNENEEIYIIPEYNSFLRKFVHCYKWRNPENVTFSLKLKNSKESAELYTSIFKNDVLFAKINGNYANKIKNKYTKECIVNVSLKGGLLDLVSESKECIYPTSLRFIENILSFIQEDIKLCELFM